MNQFLEREREMETYSVLMSVYKKESPERLREALDSMVNQTVLPGEIVLVEDGPLTHELYRVIKEYEEQYPNLLQIVINEKNMGLGPSLQRGVDACSNELIARMDTDDISRKNRCDKQLKFLHEHPDVVIVGGQIEEFVDNVKHIVGKREVPIADRDIKDYMKKRCPFNHMTVMFRKHDIVEVGNYMEWLWNEDYYLWIRLAAAGKLFANLPDTLVDVRVGRDMYQRRGGKGYFASEKKIQELMWQKGIISTPRYLVNVGERFILQVMMPNWMRSMVFKRFARKKV